jgi:hypothetical protein
MGSKIKMAIFFKLAQKILIKFQYLMEKIFLKKTTNVAPSGKQGYVYLRAKYEYKTSVL